MAFMLSVALFAGLSSSAQAANAPAAGPQTWYCDPGNVNKGIQFTLDNLAAPGDTINLWPEGWTTGNVLFTENVVVNYSVTIQGLNHGRLAWEPRGSESYVYPLVDDSVAVFLIKADHVTIDGVFIGAAGRANPSSPYVTAEHGILANATDIETDTIDNLTFTNNIVESAITGIELLGDDLTEGFASYDNVISRNFVLSYYNSPQVAKDGIEMTYDFFATVTDNKVRNINQAFYVEHFSEEGSLIFLGNKVENTNVILANAFYFHEIMGDVDALTIGDSENYPCEVINYVFEGSYYGNAVNIQDVDPGVQVTIDGFYAINVWFGILLDDVGTYDGDEIDTPVIITNVVIINAAKALYLYNDDYYYSEVSLSFAVFENIDYDAIEVNSEGTIPVAPAASFGWMRVNLVSNIEIDGADDAVEVNGFYSLVFGPADEFAGTVNFVNIEYYYFHLYDNPWDIDATNIAIENHLGSYYFDDAEAYDADFCFLFVIEDKTWHAIDVLGYGFVMYVEDVAFVAQEDVIQNAIEVNPVNQDGLTNYHVLSPSAIFVQWGFYHQHVYIWRTLDLMGVDSPFNDGTYGDLPLISHWTHTMDWENVYVWADDVWMDNFELNGTEISEDGHDAIFVYGSQNCVFSNLNIYHFGAMGIELWGQGRSGVLDGTEILDCSFSDLGMQAIWLCAVLDEMGYMEDNVLISRDIEILDNLIYDVLNNWGDYMPAPGDVSFGAAIELYGIADTLIADNEITGIPEVDELGHDLYLLSMIVTDGDENFVTGNVLGYESLSAPGVSFSDDINGIYLETDIGEYYVYSREAFDAMTPVFHNNSFYMDLEMMDQGAPGDSFENYAFMYYEGAIMDEDDVEDVQVVDARYNFWNSVMGPYSDPNHYINPNEDGTGPQVEDAINFAPWWIDEDMDTMTVDVFISENKNIGRLYVDGVDEVFYAIQWAVDAADSGDWVIVNPGAYYERVVITSSLSLLGGYVDRGDYYDAGMYGGAPGFVDILLIEGDDVSATVDNFDFIGEVTVLVNVRGATAIVSNNWFVGSLTGPAYEFNGQIAVLVDDIGTINVFGNMFDNIALDGEQDRGAIAVYSDSAADIHDNYFYGYDTATGVWAWDVTEPLNIVDNDFYGFWYGVNIQMSAEDSEPSEGIYIAGNYMAEILVGISMYNVKNTLIEENTIYGADDLPGWYSFDYSFDVMVGNCGENVVVVNNNLLSEGYMYNTVGIWNQMSDGEYVYVIANNNWWGKVSGPSGGYSWAYGPAIFSDFGYNWGFYEAFGAGTIVTDDVIVDTWLCNYFPIGTPISADYDAPIWVEEGMAHRYSPLTGIEITEVDGYGLVALGKYTSSPGKMFWGYNLGIYLEIAVNHESIFLDSMTVEIYFGDVPEGINVEELRLFFWNTEVGAWMPCIASFVDVEGGYVEMTFDDNSLPTIDMLRNDMAFLIGAPKLVITPTEGKSGIIVEAYGAGFTPMEAVVMYIGKDVLGAIPTKLEGLYFVDEDGNVSGVEIILPYLNKGEYEIKMTDPMYLAEFGEEYVASATYTVLGNSALQLALDTGAIYFAGEDVWWVGSVTEEGRPYEFREDTTVAAYIVSAETGEKLPVDEVNILADGYTFTVHIALPGEVDAGVYYLEVMVADAMYEGQDGKAFQISNTFSGIVTSLIGISQDIAALSMQVGNGFETVNVKLDAIDARVVAIEGDVVWIRTTLGDVQATVDQIDLNVIDVQDGIVILGAQIANGFSTVMSSLESLDAQIIEIQDSMAVMSSVVGEIRVYVGQIDANVTVANDGIVILTSNVGTVQTTLNAIGAQVTTINGNVATLQTAVGTVQTSINALDAKIVALQGSVVTIGTNLGTLTATVNEIGLKVTEINGRTVTMSSTLGNITGTLTAMTGSIATINTNLGTVKADVGNIASATTGINSTLAFIILAILIIVAIVLVFLRTKK